MGKLRFAILFILMLQLAANLSSSSACSHNCLPLDTSGGGKPHLSIQPPMLKPSPASGHYHPHPPKLPSTHQPEPPSVHPPSPPSVHTKPPSHQKLQKPVSTPPTPPVPPLPRPLPPSQPTTIEAIKKQVTWRFVNWVSCLITATIAMLVAAMLPYLGRLNSKIGALKSASERLQGLKDDITLKHEILELKGHDLPKGVDNWLKKVQRTHEETTQLSNRQLQLKSTFSIDYMRISIASTNLFAQVKTLLKEGDVHINSQGMKQPPAAVQEQPTNSSTFGLDSYLDKAAKCLADDQQNILGIVGIGGVGKTTLLKRINNELQPGGSLNSYGSFDRVIFVVVSKDYTQMNLSTKIAEALKLELSDDDNKDLPKLTSQISNYLSKKNFLLLLDDVWKSLKLEEVGIPAIQSGKQFKRKVMLTTRSQKVCAEMKVETKIRVDTLNKKDAWLLFEDNIPKDLITSDKRIRLAAEAIADECKGLPLALNSIGRAMASKTTFGEWREALKFMKESKHLQVPGEEDEIFRTLELSYESLKNDTDKQCFLSCALWPEDWKIDVDELVQKWIGFGFLECNSTTNYDSAYRDGIFLVGRLRNAALLEHDPDDETKVWMHDVIRDMALWIAREYGSKPNKWIVKKFKEIDNPNQLQGAKRISLLTENKYETRKYPLHCSELLSLTIFLYGYRTLSIRHLLVSPQNLQYLDLQHSCIDELREEIIISLENLFYLNLSNTDISDLPDTMKNLKKLKFLLLRSTWYLDYIPYGWISSLSDLLVLDLYDSYFRDWGRISQQERASIKEVLSLSNSLQHLGITVKSFDDLLQLSTTRNSFIRSISLRSEDEMRKMVNLVGTRPPLNRNLKELSLFCCDDSVIFEEGWNLPEIETVKISGISGFIWPKQVKPGVAMPLIRKLELQSCDGLESITWVMQLRSLVHLKVSYCRDMKQLIAEGGGGSVVVEVEEEEQPFCCLRTLVLKGLPRLHSICDGEYAFPSLKLLEIYLWGDDFRKLPFGPQITKNKHLKIWMEDETWERIMSSISSSTDENYEQLKLYLQRAFQSSHGRW